MKQKKIVVIGAGIGGIATANLLALAGHKVEIYEKASQPGGRAGTYTVDGFTFDTGPSWYLMPEVFEHYYNLLNTSTKEQFELIKLSPAYKVFFESSKPVVVTGDIDLDTATFDSIEIGAGNKLKKYVEKGDRIYNLSIKHFLYSNFETVRDFLHPEILSQALSMLKLTLTPIDKYVSKFVHDLRLKQILEYPMVFLGTSPFSAPALYSLMSALDFKEGVYYPKGGMYKIIESLVSLGEGLGVVYHYDSLVRHIAVRDQIASGINLENGSIIEADIVISNADLHYTETRLLDDLNSSYPESYWQRHEAGPSALLIYLGVQGKLSELEHHNLIFIDEWKNNFTNIYKDKDVLAPSSMYVSKTSTTDNTVAPDGTENLFILVPLPSGIEVSKTQSEKIYTMAIESIEKNMKINLDSRIIHKKIFTPNDFYDQFYSWQSSMLGQSHLLKQSAFFRTPNKSKKVGNLYYVGGSTTPGIGLPMCLISAELVYKRVIGDRTGGRVSHIEKVRE